MLAAENGGLPQGKVGGMGDVIRELPGALTQQGLAVTVLTPSYGMFQHLPGAEKLSTIRVPFAGSVESVDCYVLPSADSGVFYQVLDHPRFAPNGDARIYHDDDAKAPFATDATKFAFFSAAAAAAVASLEAKPEVVHLHDWHLGCYLALREFDPQYAALKSVRTVFTIHNLALQGTRPLKGDSSSLESWFPQLRYRAEAVADPVYPDCVNPMATAIRLADMINTVSPSYALEILKPNSSVTGMRGGEGLDGLLRKAHSEGRLTGILNGCHYPPTKTRRLGWKKLVETMQTEVLRFIAAEERLSAVHYLADKRLAALPKKRPANLLTSVGRLTDQKLRLFREPTRRGTPALERVLEELGSDGLLIVLGNGERGYERFLADVSVRFDNLLFLRGYSDVLADALYGSGDLFLMPSSFEPCGISQMLAMRAGQPCVVHAVGGLKDTVSSRTGFPFDGDTPARQAQDFVREVAAAVELRNANGEQWKAVCEAAADERFEWNTSAERYVHEVYAIDAD